jgi:hypothetical protein
MFDQAAACAAPSFRFLRSQADLSHRNRWRKVGGRRGSDPFALLIKRHLRRQWNQSEYVSRTGVEHEQTFGGFGIARKKLETAMPVNRISFPVQATLGAHDPVFPHVLIVRPGAEKHIEFGSVVRRYCPSGSRSSEPGTAARISRKPNIRSAVNASLGRETDIELKGRGIDFDIPVFEEIRKSLGGVSLQFSRRLLFVSLNASITAAYRSGERRSGKQKQQNECSQKRLPW